MIRRKIRFLDSTYSRLLYDTDIHGPWTLSECTLSAPIRQTNLITIPGRDGEIDLAPAIGDVRYEPRLFEAALECSEGTRDHRTALINHLMNKLEGRFCRIVLPDDPLRYIQGYIDVEVEYNDLNHARVRITSSVDPWRVCTDWKHYELEAAAAPQQFLIKNTGGKKVVPHLNAYTQDASLPNLTVTCGEYEHTFASYETVTPEELTMEYMDEFLLTYSGSGKLVVRWQEASL